MIFQFTVPESAVIKVCSIWRDEVTLKLRGDFFRSKVARPATTALPIPYYRIRNDHWSF